MTKLPLALRSRANPAGIPGYYVCRPIHPMRLAAIFGAMPSAHARRASHRAPLHGLGHTAPIVIAAFCIVYFALQMLRSVGL